MRFPIAAQTKRVLSGVSKSMRVYGAVDPTAPQACVETTRVAEMILEPDRADPVAVDATLENPVTKGCSSAVPGVNGSIHRPAADGM